MNCTFCHCEAPPDMEDVIKEGWIPDYYVGQEYTDGPVCPDCVQEHLRLSEDGEYELRIPKRIAHKYN